jgi:hypothetical protein
LANNNAGPNGFLMGINPNTINISITSLGSTNLTYYLLPGLIPAASLSTTAASIPLTQKTTIVGINMYYSSSVSSSTGLVLKLYNVTTPTSGGGTPFATINYPSLSTAPYRFLNVSNLIDPTSTTTPQYLQVTLTTTSTGYTSGGNVIINIGTY